MIKESIAKGAVTISVGVLMATGGWVVKLNGKVAELEKERAVAAVQYENIEDNMKRLEAMLTEVRTDVKAIRLQENNAN